jgi:hypothetical protein
MIGTIDQIVDYKNPMNGVIEDKRFQFEDEDDGNFYLILDETYDLGEINKMNTLLKDNEIFGAVTVDPTIFTYIIGTQMEYKGTNILVRDDTDPENQECNTNKMHIWAKIALSTQEINTKHNNILYDSFINYENIKNSKIDETDLFNGVIDRIYYAGELKINMKGEVVFNFLSGTYMNGLINATNPPDETIDCITNFLMHEKIGATSAIPDVTGKTFINKKMTKDLLNKYVTNINLQVGVFDNITDANNYNNKRFNLAKIQGQINMLIRSKLRFKDNPKFLEDNEVKIDELTQQYNDLMANNFNMIKYTVPVLGGKRKGKIKTKRKTKRRNCRKTKRRNCRKIYNNKRK